MASTGFKWNTNFNLSNGVVKNTDHTAKKKRYSFSIYSAVAIACMLFFIGCAFVSTDYKVLDFTHSTTAAECGGYEMVIFPECFLMQKIKIPRWETISSLQTTASSKCKDQGKPLGSQSLPRGIVSETSNLEMQSLFRFQENKRSADTSKNLLAMAVGIKQKEIVDQIVRKFISNDFIVMLFHYDGIVDEWTHFHWCDSALHVSAINQTKWWFAKRFLHPDIVAEYSYIFLWDEDLGLEHFDPKRYLQIIQEEELEISQPALDATDRSKVHHQITVRQRRNKVHRRFYKLTGGGRCYENGTGPPCTGFVEMMAPVFSRAAWRCVWYMIQNDLIYAWGLDFKLGYCAQGERTKKVGIVDAEYIDHMSIPSLGGLDLPKVSSALSSPKDRLNVRKRSYAELSIFQERWKKATEEDGCWIDPYAEKSKRRVT